MCYPSAEDVARGLTAKLATEWINKLAVDSAKVVPVQHLLDRMDDRKFLWQDVLLCLTKGSVTAVERAPNGVDWRYSVSTGQRTKKYTVIVEFENPNLLLITVIRNGK